MIQAVVFDLGEVLASPPDLLPMLAERLVVPVDDLAPLYWVGRDAYDTGADDAAYWAPLLEALDRPTDAEFMDEIALLDAGIWTGLRPDARQLLRDCRHAGRQVAVLSNSPHAMQVMADRAPWREDLDRLFISASYGVVKPDPEIYRLVTDDLRLPTERIAFVDDRPANVDAAAAEGWQAHLFVSDDDTRAWLERLGVLLPRANPQP